MNLSRLSMSLKEKQALDCLLNQENWHSTFLQDFPQKPIEANSKQNTKPVKNIRIIHQRKKDAPTKNTFQNRSQELSRSQPIHHKNPEDHDQRTKQKNLLSNIFMQRSEMQVAPKNKLFNRIFLSQKKNPSRKKIAPTLTVCPQKDQIIKQILERKKANEKAGGIFCLSFSEYCSVPKKPEGPIFTDRNYLSTAKSSRRRNRPQS